MFKKLIAFSISVVLALGLSPSTHASNIGIKIVGQKEGVVHNPIERDGIQIFPIGQILKFLDISGTETLVMHTDPLYSFITFQGECFKITHDSSEVEEYELDESGTCTKATGQVYQMDVPAAYSESYDVGIFVPLNFISGLLANSKYGNKFATEYNEEEQNLEFSMYKLNNFGSKQEINPITLAMKINSPWLLTLDDGNLFDDNDHKVTPVTRQGTTLLPIAPIISNLGGKTVWNNSDRKVTISLNDTTIELWMDKTTALVNGVSKKLTVAPTAINGRTMLPVRFVTENLGANVKWYKDSQMVVIYYGGAVENANDLFTLEYKISLLDIFQNQEDNRTTLEDAVKENQKKHNQVKYNDKDPIDYYGNTIQAGDTVGSGTFDGIVKKINGTKVLVYWNHASFVVEKGKEEETAALFGIKWLSEQWVEAKTVMVSGS
ncbi:hypothetical protein D3C74_250890 [compost metagenome]